MMNNLDTDTHPSIRVVVRIWRENRCLRKNSIIQYLRWIRRFKAYCRGKAVNEDAQLTLAGVRTFAKWYAQTRGVDSNNAFKGARSALRAWVLALSAMGYAVHRWVAPEPSKHLPSPLLQEFAEHLRQHRGNPAVTIKKKIAHITGFLAFLRSRRQRPQRVQLRDIDAFVVSCRGRYARTTVADFCSSLRSFLRFLHATGRLSVDLAPSVMAPIVRKGERPLRALSWNDVRRILQAVELSTSCGKRDYAILLLMSTYGLGAGEAIRLKLDDIDWRAATLRVTRPKTGVETRLPLLPAVARALVTYLRRGRPTHAATRHLFLTMTVPHVRLSSSSAVRHILIKHARAAGVSAPYLGSHVLRHTHACRQMELGAQTKVIGDILGHRRPESTSAYIRISTERLRHMALPVPP